MKRMVKVIDAFRGTFLLICFLLLPYLSQAQLRIMFASGYGTYSMDDLIKWQQSKLNNAPAKGQKMSSYPGYINFEGGLVYQTKKSFFAGAIIGYGSSGSRSSYGDYSGSYLYDQKAKYVSINASVGFAQKILNEKVVLNFDLRPGFTITDLEVTADERIGNDVTHEENTYHSLNVVIQPTVSATKQFGKFGVNVFAGVNINAICTNLLSDENPNDVLMDDDEHKLSADWTGLRVGMGVSYYFWRSTSK